MFKYFKELLSTLKSIQKTNEDILSSLKKLEWQGIIVDDMRDEIKRSKNNISLENSRYIKEVKGIYEKMREMREMWKT